jgi:VanZ family protein
LHPIGMVAPALPRDRQPMLDRLLPLLRLGFVLCAVSVFALAVMPGSLDPVHVWDKAKHFSAFFVLGGLAATAFPRGRLILIGLALSAFGAAIEGVQAIPFVHRDCDVFDWVADSLALLVVLGVFALIRARKLSLPRSRRPV